MGMGRNIKDMRTENIRRKKISKSLKEYKRTKEHIENNRMALLGNKQTKEHIEKRRKKLLGHRVLENTLLRIKKMKGKNWEDIYGKEKSKELKKNLKEKRAKQIFPIKDTSIEVKIQNFLKKLGIEFFTHQYMSQIKHAYQCDILIPSMNLVIECDGDYWHKYPIGNDLDHIRTKELFENGFKVLRLWENEIRVMELNDFEKRMKL